MEVTTSLDRNLWKDYVDSNRQGNIFHTPEMYDVFARAKGYRPALWAAVGDDGQILAMFTPVIVSLYGGLSKYFTSRAASRRRTDCSCLT